MDEFADFQMAVGPATSKTPKGLFATPSYQPFVGVGNRLANYNNGGALKPQTQLQPQHSSSTSNNLLIGEEDKYAALRDLVSFSGEEGEGGGGKEESWGGGRDTAPVPVDDFGDFQSFSGGGGGGKGMGAEGGDFGDFMSVHSQSVGGREPDLNGQSLKSESEPPPAFKIPDFEDLSSLHFGKKEEQHIIPGNVIGTLDEDLESIPSKSNGQNGFIKTTFIGDSDNSSNNFGDISLLDIDLGGLTLSSPVEGGNEGLDGLVLRSGEQSKVDISPETRSLASLDLGSYNGIAAFDGSLIVEGRNGGLAESGVEKTESRTEEDKYGCFKKVVDENSIIKEQTLLRTVNSIRNMVEIPVSLFSGASNSDVIREVINSEKGQVYVNSLIETFRVFQRVRTAYQSVGRNESKSESILAEVQELWETLSSYVMKDFSVYEVGVVDRSTPLHQRCHVCYLSIEDESRTLFDEVLYHTSCANLWLNLVDSRLPSATGNSNSLPPDFS